MASCVRNLAVLVATTAASAALAAGGTRASAADVRADAEAAAAALGGSAPAPSAITIRTTPPGATVMVDGAVLGRTPWSGTLAAGARRVLVVLGEHEPLATTILATGAPVVIDAVLVPPATLRARGAPRTFVAGRADAAAPASPDAATDRRGAVAADLDAKPALLGAAPIRTSPYPAIAAGLTIGAPLLGGAVAGLVGALTAAPYTGLGLGGLALVALPSAGSLYAGSLARGAAHAAVRIGTGGLVALGVALLNASRCGGCVRIGPLAAGLLAVSMGATATLGSIAYEAVDAARFAAGVRRSRPVVTAAPLVATPWGARPGATLLVWGL